MASLQGGTLSGSARRRAQLLCLLYFCQGFPWGFATIALLASLSQAGHSKAETATVAALAILPWTFKFFWAPVIDSFRLPAFGVRRPWIAMAQFCMALTLLVAAFSGSMDSDATLSFIAWTFFVHNCFASLQDVATDALAVDLLEDNERGRVNGFMWGSKIAGIAFGGAGMALVIAYAGLASAVVLQAAIILAVLGLVIAWPERPGEKRFPWSAGQASNIRSTNSIGLALTGRELARAFANRTTATLLLVALGSNLAEGVFDPLTVEFFVQDLGWTAQRYATISGTWGVTAEVAGALIGGYCCDRYGRRRMAALGLALVAVTLLTFGLTVDSWHSPEYPHVLLIPAFKGSMALATVSLFSLYMQVSWTQAAATQFTAYMALGNVGYAVGAKLNAWLDVPALALGLDDFYVIAGLAPLIPILLLIGLQPERIAARKRAERQVAPAPA